MAATALQRSDATGWFEELHREADAGICVVPWAGRFPNPLLVEFLDRAKLAGQMLPPAGARGREHDEPEGQMPSPLTVARWCALRAWVFPKCRLRIFSTKKFRQSEDSGPLMRR